MKFIRKEVLSVKEVYKQISFNIFPKGIFVGDIYEDDYNKEIVKIGNSYFSLEEHFKKVKPIKKIIFMASLPGSNIKEGKEYGVYQIKKEMYLIRNDTDTFVFLNSFFCSDIEYKWLRVKKSFSIYGRQYNVGSICKFSISKYNKSLIYNGEIVRGYVLDEILEEPTVIKTAILKCDFKSLKKGDKCNVYSVIYINKHIFYYVKNDNEYCIVLSECFEDEKEYVYYIGEDTDMLKTGMKYELISQDSDIFTCAIKVNENKVVYVSTIYFTQDIFDKLIDRYIDRIKTREI